VINPLKALPGQPALDKDLAVFQNASASAKTAWLNNYTKAATNMKFVNNQVVVNASDAGPVPLMINDLTQMARSGALDEALLTGDSFYTTDYTDSLLFISDGSYLGQVAQADHLTGSQWGMMNETGSWPGQAWLWLYTFWYQVSPMNSSSNGDVEVLAIMLLLTVGLTLMPFIPGLRSIPRKSKVYRIIWREHYQNQTKD
jgi:hypothetical protein